MVWLLLDNGWSVGFPYFIFGHGSKQASDSLMGHATSNATTVQPWAGLSRLGEPSRMDAPKTNGM